MKPTSHLLLVFIVLCSRYLQIESSTTQTSTETSTSPDHVSTALSDTDSTRATSGTTTDAARTTDSSDITTDAARTTDSSDITTDAARTTDSSDITTSHLLTDSTKKSTTDETTIDGHGLSETTTSTNNKNSDQKLCIPEPCEVCTAQRLLPLTIVLSFLAGMLVAAVPAYMYIRRIWCFYKTSDRGSCASDKATDKVIQKLTLERLNELEIKRRKKEQLEFSFSSACSLPDKGPDIVITEFNGRSSYEKLNSANLKSMSQKADEHNYYECSVESKNVRGDKKEGDENDKTTYEDIPSELSAESVKIEVTKPTADSPVVFKRGLKQSENGEAKQAALLSNNPLYAHGRETSLPETQLYENARDISSSEKELREIAPESSLLSDKQLYEHARESVMSTGDWNGLLALQNENFRDSNQLSQVF